MCAEKPADVRYGMEALALGGFTETISKRTGSEHGGAAARKGTKLMPPRSCRDPRVRLPGDRTFEDKQGCTRRDVRLR
jgi:hypothetical protein